MKGKQNLLSAGIVCLIFGVLLIAMSIGDVVTLLKPAVNPLDGNGVSLSAGDHVVMDVTAVYDYVISETTTESTYGVTTSSKESSRYYIIPTFSVEKGTIYLDRFVMAKIGKVDFTHMEEGIKRFDAWWENEDAGLDDYPSEVLLHVEGKMKKMSSEELQYVQEYFGDNDYREYIDPVVLSPIKSSGTTYALTAVGVVLLIVGAILSVIGSKVSKEQKAAYNAQAAARAQYYSTPAQGVTFNNDATPTFNNGDLPGFNNGSDQNAQK